MKQFTVQFSNAHARVFRPSCRIRLIKPFRPVVPMSWVNWRKAQERMESLASKAYNGGLKHREFEKEG